ncbi:MAG: TIGR03960 family B12-binding radical SAM protein [Deltaproteobacteria bacterium]|nr:TIGR03960 family B12-binding radical SAM protein [Deltaproteobacteria bacterium]
MMSILDQPWFSNIKRPSRYLGNEINLIKKDPAAIEVSIALAFPDIYEVGMSHLGLKILYHILNSHDWLAAERVFCPFEDLERELRDRRLPLTTLESDRPLSSFNIVGFSLQHELSLTNILNILDLSGIPFLSEKRDHSFPLIIAGGPACFNPEPVASLFDAIVIGDGEEAALEICRRVRERKPEKVKRKEDILTDIANIRGVYVPAFFEVHYKPEGTINTIEPLIAGYKEVKKAVVSDIDHYPFPTCQVVPFTELVHDRLTVEISRGCTRGCRFCQAGMIYRPVRERNPQSVIKNVETALRLTGFEELSLLSLSSGDYSCLGPLLKALMDRQSGDNIAISLPSLRIDSLDPAWLEQIRRVRKTGFTLAPEAGNDRLRKIINKALTDKNILDMAREIYGAGWNLIKLYFMIGLPGEEDRDLRDIIYLAKEISNFAGRKGKKAKLNISLSIFVPKSHTPFMWAPQVNLEEGRRRIQLIQNAFKNSRVRVKWNQPEMSWLEGIFSRGDRRLTKVLIEAWRMGARFDAWGEHFKMDIWKEAFKRSGLDPEFYLYRSRSTDEVPPWDHINSGVTKGYLKKEWKRALEGKITPDCRKKCLECGVCDHEKIDPILFENWVPPSIRCRQTSNHGSTIIKRYRITFSKTDIARYLGHLELVRLFIRAFKRAGLNLVYSKGYHPMPKLSFTTALPVGTESLHETADIELYETMPISSAREKIDRQLPTGIRINSLEDVTHKVKSPRLWESHFHITTNGLKMDLKDLQYFLQSDHFPVTKSGKKGNKIINARSLVKSMSLTPPHGLNLIITHTSGPELKPIDIIKAVFHLDDHHVKGIKILKTKQVMRYV